MALLLTLVQHLELVDLIDVVWLHANMRRLSIERDPVLLLLAVIGILPGYRIPLILPGLPGLLTGIRLRVVA